MAIVTRPSFLIAKARPFADRTHRRQDGNHHLPGWVQDADGMRAGLTYLDSVDPRAKVGLPSRSSQICSRAKDGGRSTGCPQKNRRKLLICVRSSTWWLSAIGV